MAAACSSGGAGTGSAASTSSSTGTGSGTSQPASNSKAGAIMAARSELEVAPRIDVSKVSTVEQSSSKQSDALVLATIQMQNINGNEIRKRYRTKQILRSQRLEIENAPKRKDEIIRGMRIRLDMVVATIKMILKSSNVDGRDAKVKQEKNFMLMMQAKRLMHDVATGAVTFYAQRMKRELEAKDRIRERRKFDSSNT